MINIHFQKANLSHKNIIFEWLEKPHMREFWDNSPKHSEDILNYMNGRKKRSDYFGGTNNYWVGLIDTNPVCFILTHEETDDPDTPEPYRSHVSKTGKTYGLDFGIGNEAYVGIGIAVLTLNAFMKFIVEEVDPEVDTFFIDPFVNNPRAIHVYKKAGFQIVAEFTQHGGYFDQSEGVLMLKTVHNDEPTSIS